MAEAIVLDVEQASSQEEGREKTYDRVVSCTVVKRVLRRDGDASAGDLGQIRFRGSQAQSGYHRLPGRGPGDLGPGTTQRWSQWGAMPPLPKARALKRDDNVGLDLELQMGRWGSRPSLPIYCKCLARYLVHALGVSRTAPLGPGPSEWRPTLRQPSLSPTFLPTPILLVYPKGGRHMRKQGRYTHHSHTPSPTQPVGTRAHAIHDLRRLAPSDKSSRGADSALLNRPRL